MKFFSIEMSDMKAAGQFTKLALEDMWAKELSVYDNSTGFEKQVSGATMNQMLRLYYK